MNWTTHLSCQTRRACQTFADTASGSPQPVRCPYPSDEPCRELYWNSHNRQVPVHVYTKGPEGKNGMHYC